MVQNAQDDIKAKVNETSAEFLELVKARITNLSTLWNNLTILNPVVKDPSITNEVDDVLAMAARYEEPNISISNVTDLLTDIEDYDFDLL